MKPWRLEAEARTAAGAATKFRVARKVPADFSKHVPVLDFARTIERLLARLVAQEGRR